MLPLRCAKGLPLNHVPWPGLAGEAGMEPCLLAAKADTGAGPRRDCSDEALPGGFPL